MKKNNYTLCIAAGSSGGHTIPALTFAQQQFEKCSPVDILFFSTSKELDTTIVAHAQIPIRSVHLVIEPIPYARIWRFPLFVLRLIKAIFVSLYYLKKYRPASVTSFGGIATVPVCFAAYLLRIPFDLYSLDATAGLAIKKLAPLARTIYTCFDQTAKQLKQYPCVAAHYPLKFSQQDRLIAAEPIYQKLAFDPRKKTIFILGGSQGSLFINETVLSLLDYIDFTSQPIQVIHQVGNQPVEPIKHWYKKRKIPAHIFAFEQNIGPYYRIAQLALCRSGAGTLFELAFFGVPTITIPLRIKNSDHQLTNAQAFARQYPELINYIEQKHVVQFPSLLLNQIEEKIRNKLDT